MIPNRIARLNANGTTDLSFNPGAGLNAEGLCINLDAAGQVVAGGGFNMVSGFLQSKLAFFEADGTLITGTPTPSDTVRTLVTQASGEILLGGDFTSISGTPRNRIARILPDLSLEVGFNPDANADIYACALQDDGKILVGGAMTQVGASTRNGVARLYNESASNVLSVPSLTEAQWLRSGATQDAQRVTFEKDIGAGYVTTGITVSRIDGGWKATITPDLVNGSIRARAFPTDSHSQGMIEDIVSFVVDPSIEVSVQGVVRTSGVGNVDFGFSQTGVANSLVVNIVNRGLANLTLTSAVLTTGTQWTILAQPTTPVLSGGSASFTLSFIPTTPGAKTDTVTINSNDPTTPAFTISLVGFGSPGPGTLDTTWQPVPNNTVNALSRSPSDFSWVGGLFTTVSGFSRGRYAFIDDSAVVQAQTGVGANGFIFCAAQLPDGKVMIGGTFTAVNGVIRNRLARLNPNGSLDTSFNLSVTGSQQFVSCFALQPDGSLLVGGGFLSIGNVARSCLARLTPAGAVDLSFNANTGGTGGVVLSLALQTDNKIIAAGQFIQVNGDFSKRKVCRINSSDGTLDNTFAAVAITSTSGQVTCVTLDGTGKVLLAGDYTAGAVTGLNRFTSVGEIDTTFTNNVTDAQSLAVQADGSILVGSSSRGSLASTERLFRLTTLGVVDTSFAANARNTVSGILLQEDGKLLVGGSFTLAGSPRFLARVINGPASSSLTVVGPTEITWTRGGTLPECQTVVFDLSQDNGTSWNRLGQGERISDGWRIIATSVAGPLLPGFFFGSLPVSGTVRARAYVQGGLCNGSVSIIEEQKTFSGLPSPDLFFQVGSIEILEGGSVPFNAIFGGTNTTTSVLLSNIGGAELNNVSASVSTSSSSIAGEFAIVSTPAATIYPTFSTTLVVQFSPAAGIVGYREASLRIVSSNPGLKNPYDVILRGTAIAAPTATTGARTLIPGGSVTFNGTFKANHDEATAYFQYKLTSSNVWISTEVSTLTGFTAQVVSKTVAGLTVGQPYHFRAVIYNTVNNITSIPTTGGNLSPALVFVGTISATFTAT